MSDELTVRAPGKLFVLGEYAVLDGCPAVVAAVDRHAEVRLIRAPSGSTVRIEAPGIGAVAEFPATAVPVAEGPLAFALAALRFALGSLPGLADSGLSLSISSNLADVSGTKTGLGSSAAVTVAVVGALFAAAGRNVGELGVRDEIFRLSLNAHRTAQTGVGSGADVAASCYGGVIVFEPGSGNPRIRPLLLPEDTALLVGWTGIPASTATLVQRYLAARNGGAAKRAAFVQDSRACVAMFLQALDHGTVSAAALNSNGDAIEQLGAALGMTLVTSRLKTLITLARQHGVGAKLSGAGGGDCGIALTRQPAVAQQVRAAWRAAGIVPLDLGFDREGVSVGHT